MLRMATSNEKSHLAWPFPVCEPGGTRTPNLLIRSQVLYPIKLQVRMYPKTFHSMNLDPTSAYPMPKIPGS